ncbi:RNA-guided endonuclease InsQ/TnpB family protein (plasmid) [Streptomyces sp. HUAS TT11]|uniref:RNA-guided endonuclease InsQ/TnpB family protein n=1 Tax=Streptomyces sp. HUAS TT11 TaxID=3447508 RepID=UPI003F65C43A
MWKLTPLQETIRVFRFALDPSATQEAQLLRWAGNARLAFNYALAEKKRVYSEWRAKVDAAVAAGTSEKEARKLFAFPRISKPEVYKKFAIDRGDDRKGLDGVCPWWHEINTYVFQSAFLDADAAWKNWLASLKSPNAARAGFPRFKKRDNSKNSFRIHHNVKKPSIRLVGNRRLFLPKFGEIRIHNSGKRLARLLEREGARVQSVTVRQTGRRWYASVLCHVFRIGGESVKQDASGRDIVVSCSAERISLGSDTLDRSNQRELEHRSVPASVSRSQKSLAKSYSTYKRTTPWSKRHYKARKKLADRHRQLTERRDTYLHAISKEIAQEYTCIAYRDEVKRSASELIGENGSHRYYSGRTILDGTGNELLRQLQYKGKIYGATVTLMPC